jgi:hypothetical protein
VNVFNVRYIDQLAHWISLQHFDFVYWNIMHDAWYFSIATLSDSAKAQITEHLRSADIPPKYRDEFDRITDFMNNGASTDGVEILQQIQKLDQRRNQDLKTVEPELWKILHNLET